MYSYVRRGPCPNLGLHIGHRWRAGKSRLLTDGGQDMVGAD